jgi:tRNA dimethylallyltransferase
MFELGLMEETKSLLDRGLGSNLSARQALGYRQVIDFLEGKKSLPETIALVKQRTRQYAKRQMTWFRNQQAIQWVEVRPVENPLRTVESILDKWRETDGAAPLGEVGSG